MKLSWIRWGNGYLKVVISTVRSNRAAGNKRLRSPIPFAAQDPLPDSNPALVRGACEANRVALWPPGFVTVTFTAPACDGVVAVIVVLLTTVTLVAGVEPKVTAAPDWKFVPFSWTESSPGNCSGGGGNGSNSYLTLGNCSQCQEKYSGYRSGCSSRHCLEAVSLTHSRPARQHGSGRSFFDARSLEFSKDHGEKVLRTTHGSIKYRFQRRRGSLRRRVKP